MKRALLIVAVAFVAALARADMTQLPVPVMDALSSIDHPPNTTDLDTILGGGQPAQTASQLAAIAVDPNVDVGVALRSIHALSLYPQALIGSSLAHDTLASLIGSHQGNTKLDILLLRAAIESLGLLRVTTDVDTIAQQLDHPSRDVRAAAARALRDLGNTAAIPALRLRYSEEMVPQVKLAIGAALAALGGG